MGTQGSELDAGRGWWNLPKVYQVALFRMFEDWKRQYEQQKGWYSPKQEERRERDQKRYKGLA